MSSQPTTRQIKIYQDGVRAGTGILSAEGRIEDCPAVLGPDDLDHTSGEQQDYAERVYAAIEDAIQRGEDSLTLDGIEYDWTIEDDGDHEDEADDWIATAVETDGTWAVDDAAGGRWFPGDDAEAEILASEDPAATAVRICRETPMRGTWHN